jgi:uncharacterized membrane protein (DUF441 family)
MNLSQAGAIARVTASARIHNTRSLAIAGGIGVGFGVVMSGLRAGETPMPTVDGAVRSTITSALMWGAVNAAFAGLSVKTGPKAPAAVAGGVSGAILGVAFNGGETVGRLGAHTVGI